MTFSMGQEQKIQPDRDAMMRHLEHLFGGDLDGCHNGKIELAWNGPYPDKDGRYPIKYADWFDTDQLDDLIERACEINQVAKQNVYIGAALRKNDAPFGRASDSDFLALTAYYCDLDDKEATAHINDNYRDRVRPTCIVITGETPAIRAQLWFKLDEPDRNPESTENATKGLASHLLGDPTVTNPSRVMRLGGSIAWDLKPGRIVEITKVILPSDDRQKIYHQDQIKRAYPYVGPHSKSNDQPDDGIREGMFNRLSAKLAFQRLKEAEVKGTGWRKIMLPLVGHWIMRGLSDAEILAMAEEVRWKQYSIDETKSWLASLIDYTRKKYSKPNTDQSFEEAPEEPSEARPASSFSGLPPEREWVVQDWIPALAITSLYGDGGMGKTLLAQQLGTACVTGTPWLSYIPTQMPVLAVLCEDDEDELHRRQSDINAGMGCLMHPGLDQFLLWSRVGSENILINFDQKNAATPSPYYHALEKKIASMAQGPKLLLLDGVSDLYGGNEIIRAQVNAFIKTWLGAWVKKYACTIVLLAHPSAAGKATNNGLSGSTAWNNAVRSRLYLTRPEDADPSVRILTRQKSNYSASGNDQKIELVWERGIFTTQASPDTVDRIEKRAVKKEILRALRSEWDKNIPLGARNSKRPVREVLPSLLRQFDRGLIMKAFAELERDGFITTQHGDTHRRGYKVIQEIEE